MSPEGFPRVTLEVRAMGETITAAFADHAGKVSEEVARGVKQAVEKFDYTAEVHRAAQPIIQKAIFRRHLEYWRVSCKQRRKAGGRGA